MDNNRDNRNSTILYVSVGVCLFLYLTTYLLNNSQDAKVAAVEEGNMSEAAEQDAARPPVKKRRSIVLLVREPTTHISYLHTHILREILLELYIKREMCTPEDVNNEEKHRLPPKASSKTMKATQPPVMVVYIAVALLLTSLGAALVDFFKARSDLNSPTVDGKKKPSLTRKCSLADLTVLRHSRKELLRKDSVPEEMQTSKSAVSGRSQPTLHRRCTFHGNAIDFGGLQLFRSSSLDGEREPKHSRYRLFLRRH